MSKIEDPSMVVGSFSCPSFRLIQQLLAEVKALRLEIRDRFDLYPEVIDNADLIRLYKISKTTSQTWRNRGLGYIKMGGKLYYNRKEVELFLAKHRRKGF